MLHHEDVEFKRVKASLALLEVGMSELSQLTFGVESFLELLHVTRLGLAIDAAQFHEVSSLVLEKAHYVLQGVLTETIEDAILTFCCSHSFFSLHVCFVELVGFVQCFSLSV